MFVEQFLFSFEYFANTPKIFESSIFSGSSDTLKYLVYKIIFYTERVCLTIINIYHWYYIHETKTS